MTGIIGALDIEVKLLIDELEDKKTEEHSIMTFYSGRLRGRDVVIAQCGVGKVAAAVCAQIMITRYNVAAIINTGVAGALNPLLRQGDVVFASSLVQHDVDTTAFGDDPGYITATGCVYMRCDEALSRALGYGKLASDRYTSTFSTIATGDQFVHSEERTNFIRGTFCADACDMEGGAIAQVCIMAGIPFAAARCMSDNANGEAAIAYSDFAPIAAQRCANIVMNALEQNVGGVF